MKNDFSEFFPEQSSEPKYNNIPFSPNNDILLLSRMGLHHIHNLKMQKEQHLHSHSFAELHFSLSGFAVYSFGNHLTVKLNEGSWLLIPAGYPHKIIDYSSRYVKYSCSFNVAEDREGQYEQSAAYLSLYEIIHLNEPKQGIISETVELAIKQIYRRMFDSNPLAAPTIKSLTASIVFDTIYDLNQKEYSEKEPEGDTRLPIAIQFIKDNLNRPITGKDVARKVYLSDRQLNRIFYSNFSVSVAEFILEQKCDEAKKLITSTTLPIYEISERLGFSDQSYFIRFFKKRTGITPFKFRTASKKGK